MNLNRFFNFTIILLALFTVGCISQTQPIIATIDELDIAIRDASDYLNDNIPEGSMIVILNLQSDSAALSDYIIDELIANAVNDRIFKVVDRHQLDLIRTEQNFQLSGEVDDNLALSIGQFFGAQTIVSGRISQMGERYRMTIRALDVQTARVQGQYNRNIAFGPTIAALMGSSGGGAQAAFARATGTSQTTSRAPEPTVTGVAISPDNVRVAQGQSQQFNARVSGNNNPEQSVIWTIAGNVSRDTNINNDGLLTVADDEIAASLTITATSTDNQSRNATSAVTVPGGAAAMNVNNVSTWNTAINRIRSGGNGQSYIINVTGNFSVSTVAENLFGSVTGLTVVMQGRGTISISVNGSLLRIGGGQRVILKDVTLRGRSGNDSPLVVIMGGGVFSMEGNASVTRNASTSIGGVHVNGGTFILQDNATVSGNIKN